jgi:leucyl-tRNA synthetase
MVECGKCGWVPVLEDQLPVTLPDLKDFKPRDDGESPLASVESWVRTVCPQCGGEARRETDVMPNWAGSSWYFLRYTDPKNENALANPEKLRYWMPVDWYNGGMEHTTLHLLYSRFWNLFLYDIGAVPTPEPYAKRTSHGMILGAGGVKMSKSRGNVVNPDDVVAKYGADALRLYELFIGPFDQAIPWDDRGIEGTRRFIDRVWNTALSGKIADDAESVPLLKAAHRLVDKVGSDIESMGYNTAVAAMMVFLNTCEVSSVVPRGVWELFVKVLAPFAPHLAEELWHELGHEGSVHAEAWPRYDPALLVNETATVVVQVNGKLRATVIVPREADRATVEALARAEANVARYLAGGEVRKTIFVPDRLINFVL